MARLPNFAYQYKLDLHSNFNNQLMAGINSGLSLYDTEQDTKLYKNTDTTEISTRKMNFDDINKELDEKGKAYNQGKQLIKGAIDKIKDVTSDTEKNIKEFLSNLFKISPEYKLMAVAILVFIVLRK
jgi:hypothetical protein